MAEETRDNARVTMNMLYQKQLDNEKLLIQLSAKLEAMENLPRRVYELELRNARNAWIEKVAYAGLLAGVSAIAAAIINLGG